MSSLTDKVLTEIMKGCKRQAVTEAREELAASRGKIKQLQVDRNKLLRRVKELEKGESSLIAREEKIKLAARKIKRSFIEVTKLKDRKIGNMIYDKHDYYRIAEKETRALTAVLKMIK